MSDKTYNGWANYETWLVALWMDNDEGSYTRIKELVEEYDGKEDYELADGLKEEIHTWLETDEAPAGLKADLLNAALSEVDWLEIARNKRDE